MYFFCKPRRIFICYLIESCRPSATTEAYDNGTRKGNEGNEISPGSFNTTFLIACILIGVLVLLVILAGIIIYKKGKKGKV